MTLTTKKFCALVAGAAMAATIAIPAEAATVTGSLEFTGFDVINSISSSGVDFDNSANTFFVSNTSTGTFASLVGNGITIVQDLTIPVNGPFTFFEVSGGPSFRVDNVDNIMFASSGEQQQLTVNVLGSFISGGDETPANPSSFLITLDNSVGNVAAFSIESSVRSAPTPALLPGLLGMGAATLRKRKLAAAKAGTEVKA